MKSIILGVIVAIILSLMLVLQVSAETNAQRFARGLPPLSPPQKRSEVVARAGNGVAGSSPSGVVTRSTRRKTALCCDLSGYPTDPVIAEDLELHGIQSPANNVLVGLDCSFYIPGRRCMSSVLYCDEVIGGFVAGTHCSRDSPGLMNAP